MRFVAAALCVIAACGGNKSDETDLRGGVEGAGSARPKTAPPGGGFSDDLAQDLGSGSGSAGSSAAGSSSDVGSGSGSAVVAAPIPTAPTPPPPSHAPVPKDIAAIKLALMPNWDRDVEGPGTISFVVKVPNSDATKTFVFQYGYDDPKAPTDRDAYKKWLADQSILKPTLDRQRGAAWYLEGVDGTGAPAFRYQVLYGGKHLVCGGLLYKDAASNPLGDIRDQSIIQAKQICESLAL
ncbi:MAG TPA: hypothetical protein VGM88_01325 [Kofleriaceae bacterium]